MPAPGLDIDFESDLTAEIEKRTGYYAATEEMHDEARFMAEVPEERRLAARGIEVGHIFNFGTKYSEPLKALVATGDGKEVAVQMGSYGVGVSRLVGAAIEANHDEKGCVWPAPIAPFDAAVVNLRVGDDACDAASESAYAKLQTAGLEALYDDRDERPGTKLSTLELIGIPSAIVIGPRGLKSGVVELKDRRSGATEEVSLEAALNKLTATKSMADA